MAANKQLQNIKHIKNTDADMNSTALIRTAVAQEKRQYFPRRGKTDSNKHTVRITRQREQRKSKRTAEAY